MPAAKKIGRFLGNAILLRPILVSLDAATSLGLASALHHGWTIRTGTLYALPLGETMAVETTYTSLRERLASILDQVANDQEVVIVRRRGAKDVALVPADELTSLMETAHLLRSPKNAQRLLAALQRATRGKSRPQSIDKLRREMGLGAAH